MPQDRPMRLGLMTSGGDCAGLDAAIRAVTRRAVLHYGWEVIGIRRGTQGLLERPVDAAPLGPEELDAAMLRMGGTIIETVSRGDPFAAPGDLAARMIDGFRRLDLGALVAIGGDGSLRILRRLAEEGGIPLVFIPKTIDNDVPLVGRAIGHDTAVAVATDAMDRLHDVASSQDRILVLEVMGRDVGHIALACGIAGGADAILVPEIPFRFECLVDHLSGGGGAVVVLAEGVRDSSGRIGAARLAEMLHDATGKDARATVLGHLQRGGAPVASDRILASALGSRAVDLVADGRFGRMVGWRGDGVVEVALADVPPLPSAIDPAGELVRVARALGICFGDVEGEGPAISG